MYKLEDIKDTIICGDSALVLKEIQDNSIPLIVTSPPYGTLRKNKDYNDIYDFEIIAQESYRILQVGGIFCWNEGDQTIKGRKTASPYRHLLYFMSLGFYLDDIIIYNKNSFTFPSKNRYHNTWEPVFILSKGPKKTFNPLMDRENKTKRSGGPSGRKQNGERNTSGGNITNKEYGKRFNVWNYIIGGNHNTKDKKIDHPALMHEKLASDLISSFSNPSDIVLDIFSGGGTTCAMAKKLGRNYIGIEISPEYVKLSEERIQRIMV